MIGKISALLKSDALRELIVYGIVGVLTTLVNIFAFALLTRGGAESALYQLLSGGLMLGAWFMATDYTTSPTSNVGRMLFGVCCGMVVFVIRRFSAMPEGTSYAILFMNLFVPLIDRYVRPGRRGRKDA